MHMCILVEDMHFSTGSKLNHTAMLQKYGIKDLPVIKQYTHGKATSPTHRSVKWQNEAPLGIIFCRSTVTSVPTALQVLKTVVGVMQHSCLLTCLLSVDTFTRVHLTFTGRDP